MATTTSNDEFEESLEIARSLLGSSDSPSELWEANERVNRALHLRPEEPEAWLLKAQVLSALDDEVAAYASIEQALKRAPKSVEANYLRGALLYDMELYEESLRTLDKALKLRDSLAQSDSGSVDGDEDDAWLVEEIYYEKASVYDALDRSDEALSTFEEGLRRCPESELLKSGLEPLRRERVRRTFRVLPGGRQ